MLNISQEELVMLFEERFGKITANGSASGCYGWLVFNYYDYPLPNSVKYVDALDLRGYKHPLPNSITNVNGRIFIGNNYMGLPDNIYKWDCVNRIEYFI